MYTSAAYPQLPGMAQSGGPFKFFVMSHGEVNAIIHKPFY
jgi:hypothetical protein